MAKDNIECIAIFVSKKGNVQKDENAHITSLNEHTMTIETKYKINPENLIAIDTLFGCGTSRLVIAGEPQFIEEKNSKINYLCTFPKSQGANKYINMSKAKRKRATV